VWEAKLFFGGKRGRAVKKTSKFMYERFESGDVKMKVGVASSKKVGTAFHGRT